MRIAHFDLQNFRKLKCCRIELDKQKTLFVGANNSGKTSAMDALILFLKRSTSKRITTTDFTLSNWAGINEIGEQWVSNSSGKTKPDFSRALWEPHLPTLDTWISVEENEIHHVSHLIPSLDWNSGTLGVRLILEPVEIEELFKRYIAAFNSAKETIASRTTKSNNGSDFSLWPQNMQKFLGKELSNHFRINAYILDPTREDEEGPQKLPDNAIPLDGGDPFSGLFKIDIINAQRGFSDPNSEDTDPAHDRRLSSQFRKYFDKHLNPEDMPDENDVDALEAIFTARKAFDEKLKTSFSSALGELEGLNYPGFSNPSILLSSNVKPLDSLDHDSAVQFSVNRSDRATSMPLTLPEKYNGLGYQNLISMVFKLIRFRDEWMRVKKARKEESGAKDKIQVLHLVLIEEPEAHLHAQVQQVFIRKAYAVLREHPDLQESGRFTTQMVVSTHSSHIAHEMDFTCLRYFRRKAAPTVDDVPCATVANLITVFGDESDTAKFATRYLKTTHCDLFFADAAILVEGPAEKMLVPHFIRSSSFKDLDKSYLTILEIGGSHAHQLRPLVEKLELITLVITDLDPIKKDSNKKCPPEKGKNLRTRNSSIKTWAPGKTDLDEVLAATKKTTTDGNVCIAYQCAVSVELVTNDATEAIPYTFEDSLVLANIGFFKTQNDKNGLLGRMAAAANKDSIPEMCESMYEALESGSKAEMALELLYQKDPKELEPPAYIREGLDWLQKKLKTTAQEFPEAPRSENVS